MAELTNVVKYNDETHTLRVQHPVTEKYIGLTIEVRSSGSEEVKGVYRQQGTKNFKRFVKGQSLDGERLENNELDRVVACIVSWKWEEDEEGELGAFYGKQPEFSPKVARQMLRELDWIFRQVKDAADDEANFTKT